jgi:hypothetical protein
MKKKDEKREKLGRKEGKKGKGRRLTFPQQSLDLWSCSELEACRLMILQ